MSKPVETAKKHEPPSARDVANFALDYLWRAANRARPWLGGRRGLILLAVAVLAVGGALNWSWLVAIGAAPLLIAVAPCAVMCALGVCLFRKAGGACAAKGEGEPTDDRR